MVTESPFSSAIRNTSETTYVTFLNLRREKIFFLFLVGHSAALSFSSTNPCSSEDTTSFQWDDASAESVSLKTK